MWLFRDFIYFTVDVLQKSSKREWSQKILFASLSFLCVGVIWFISKMESCALDHIFLNENKIYNLSRSISIQIKAWYGSWTLQAIASNLLEKNYNRFLTPVTLDNMLWWRRTRQFYLERDPLFRYKKTFSVLQTRGEAPKLKNNHYGKRRHKLQTWNNVLGR